MVKQMPNPGMPKSKSADKFRMTKPEVALNVQKGFPVPKRPVRQHKRF